MTIPPLVLKRNFKASRDQVFTAWSKPEQMGKWLKPNAEWTAQTTIDFHVGGRYSNTMIDKDGKGYEHFGEFKEIIPPTKIVFTWSSHCVTDTLVTVELEEVNGETQLTLTHEFLPNEKERDGHNGGWIECFNNLEQHLRN